ncbi:MAG: PEP-CTERM sorting domain-containing protein [Planctomycetota bacterium]|nr:PEP-CTERM sorting domain-containing protein [Planctomycetota bacterium]
MKLLNLFFALGLSAVCSVVQAHGIPFNLELDGNEIVAEQHDYFGLATVRFETAVAPDGSVQFQGAPTINITSGIANGTFLGFNTIGPVYYSNGAASVRASTPLTVRTGSGAPVGITLDSSLSALTDLTKSATVLMGAYNGTDDFHSTLDFSIDNAAPNGIYRVGLQMSGPNTGFSSSETFYVHINKGLTDPTQYNSALSQLGVVPEPATLALLGCGVACLGLICQRQSRRRSA